MSQASSFISCLRPLNNWLLVLTSTTPIVTNLISPFWNHSFLAQYRIGFSVKEKEKQTLEKIQNAKTKIRNEIRELKDRLKLAQENMQLVKEKVDAEELLVEDAL